MAFRIALAALVMMVAAGAKAQPCVSVADGAGGTVIHCPDGRTGYLHQDGAGPASGLFAGQPVIADPTSLGQTTAAPAPTPGAANIDPPAPAAPAPPSVAVARLRGDAELDPPEVRAPAAGDQPRRSTRADQASRR